MASKLLEEINEEHLNCSICLNQLEDPKLLACFHRFCLKCLDIHFKKVGLNSEYFCPLCRDSSKVPVDGAKSLKSDFLIQSIVEKVNLSRDLLQKGKQGTCCQCKSNELFDAYCSDCGGFLCKRCNSLHDVLDMMKEHDSVLKLSLIHKGISSIQIEDLVVTSDKAPRCEQHRDQRLYINCLDCGDMLICSTCAALEHQNHKVEKVSSAASRKRDMISEEKEKIQVMKENTVSCKTKMEETNQILQQQIGDAKLQIERTRLRRLVEIKKETQDKLDELEKIKKQEKYEACKKENDVNDNAQNLVQDIEMKQDMLSKSFNILVNKTNCKLARCENGISTASLVGINTSDWAVLKNASDLCRALQSLQNEDCLQEDDLDFRLRYYLLKSDSSAPNGNFEFVKMSQLECFKTCGRTLTCLASCEQDIMGLSSGKDEERTFCTLKIYSNKSNEVYFYRKVVNILADPGSLPIVIESVHPLLVFVWSASVIYLNIRKSNYSEIFKLGQKPISAIAVDLSVDPALIYLACYNSRSVHVVAQGEQRIQKTFDVKVNCETIVSLATTNVGTILGCDGQSEVFLFNKRGENLCKFSPVTDIKSEEWKPLVVRCDSSDVVYVLWSVHRQTDRIGRKLVVLYDKKGLHMLPVILVDANVTLMTTISKDDNGDQLVVGAPDGSVTILNRVDNIPFSGLATKPYQAAEFGNKEKVVEERGGV